MEKMNLFFAERIDGYDEHMLANVMGCKEGYIEMAKIIPSSCKSLLDLGCGTGLELDEIFQRMLNIDVTGIDLTQEMLNKLRQKHPDKSLHLICGSYFDVPFEIATYDCAISFQTMHHFSHDMKINLYKKILIKFIKKIVVYKSKITNLNSYKMFAFTVIKSSHIKIQQTVHLRTLHVVFWIKMFKFFFRIGILIH